MLEALKTLWCREEPAPETLKDRKAGLIIFGAVDILFGIFCFSLGMLLMIIVSVAGLGGFKPSHFLILLIFCFFLTGWYVWLGMGSLKGRRWARTLLLVGAWIALFFGALMLAILLFLLPEFCNILADSGMMTPVGALSALSFTIGLIAFLQVAFPVAIIIFYGSSSVRLTCERLNPNPCWTEKTPLPLLAMGVVFATGCFSVIVAATTNYTVFFFGRILSGWAGGVVTTVIAVACGYVGWGAYVRKKHAWWLAYAMIVIISSSLMLTFSDVEMEVMYSRMGYTLEQIEQLRQVRLFSPLTLVLLCCIWGVVASSYLVWVYDLFSPERTSMHVYSYRRLKKPTATEASSEPRVRMRLD